MDCIFCKIINKEIPCYKIYEDDIVLAFLDINPKENGHTLIIPKKHTLDINTIDDNILLHIINCSKKIAQNLNLEGYTLSQNNGIVEEVKHFHLHMIPAYKETQQIINVEDMYKKITNNN